MSPTCISRYCSALFLCFFSLFLFIFCVPSLFLCPPLCLSALFVSLFAPAHFLIMASFYVSCSFSSRVFAVVFGVFFIFVSVLASIFSLYILLILSYTAGASRAFFSGSIQDLRFSFHLFFLFIPSFIPPSQTIFLLPIPSVDSLYPFSVPPS